MRASNEFSKAITQAKILLKKWRKSKVGNSAYSEELLKAFVKAARLGGCCQTTKILGIGWSRLRKAMRDPRYQENTNFLSPENINANSVISADKETVGANLVTFTQFIPIENIAQDKSVAPFSNQVATLEVLFPKNTVIRVFEANPLILAMLKETLLSISGGTEQ